MSTFKYIRHNLINFIVYIVINIIALSFISIETYEYFKSPYKIFNQFNNDDTYFNVSFNNTNALLEPSGNKFNELISKEFNSEITNIIPIINLKDFKEDNVYLVNNNDLEVNKIYMDNKTYNQRYKDETHIRISNLTGFNYDYEIINNNYHKEGIYLNFDIKSLNDLESLSIITYITNDINNLYVDDLNDVDEYQIILDTSLKEDEVKISGEFGTLFFGNFINVDTSYCKNRLIILNSYKGYKDVGNAYNNRIYVNEKLFKLIIDNYHYEGLSGFKLENISEKKFNELYNSDLYTIRCLNNSEFNLVLDEELKDKDTFGYSYTLIFLFLIFFIFNILMINLFISHNKENIKCLYVLDKRKLIKFIYLPYLILLIFSLLFTLFISYLYHLIINNLLINITSSLFTLNQVLMIVTPIIIILIFLYVITLYRLRKKEMIKLIRE